MAGADKYLKARAQLWDIGATEVGNIDAALLDELSQEADSLIEEFHGRGYRSDDYWYYTDGEGNDRLYRIHNLERQNAPRIQSIFKEGPLHRIATELFQGEAVVTVCAMVVKLPGVAGVPWHRDRVEYDRRQAINLSIYLDKSSPENGCLEYVPGSHTLPDDALVQEVRETGPIDALPVAAGAVTAHDVRLVHGSGDNGSETQRRSIVIEFVAADHVSSSAS